MQLGWISHRNTRVACQASLAWWFVCLALAGCGEAFTPGGFAPSVSSGSSPAPTDHSSTTPVVQSVQPPTAPVAPLVSPWVGPTIGFQGFYSTAFVLDANDRPIVARCNFTTIDVSVYDGNTWQPVGPTIKNPNAFLTDPHMAVAPDGALYLSYTSIGGDANGTNGLFIFLPNPNTWATLVRNENGSWQGVGGSQADGGIGNKGALKDTAPTNNLQTALAVEPDGSIDWAWDGNQEGSLLVQSARFSNGNWTFAPPVQGASFPLLAACGSSVALGYQATDANEIIVHAIGAASFNDGIFSMPGGITQARLAMDSNCAPLVVWRGDVGLFAERYGGTSWAGLEVTTHTAAFYPDVAAAHGSQPVLVWLDTLTNGNGSILGDFFGGSPLAPGSLTDGLYPGTSDELGYPHVAIDSQGHPWVQWEANSESGDYMRVLGIY